jgi:hypothetical protein
VKTGVQKLYNQLKKLDSGLAVIPDPIRDGMTKNGVYRLFTGSSSLEEFGLYVNSEAPHDVVVFGGVGSKCPL